MNKKSLLVSIVIGMSMPILFSVLKKVVNK